MKTLILPIAILTCLATATPTALAQDTSFPEVGRTYNVFWAPQDGRLADGKIKVIRKADGPWIFVEYTYMRYDPPAPAAVSSSTPATPPARPKPVPPPQLDQANWTPVKKQLWINTNWILTASELEPEKK